jgi:putative transposase
MPSQTKRAIAATAALPPIPEELIDQLVSGPTGAKAVNDLSFALKKALIERVLGV